METIQSINLIMINPDVRNGKPCIAGTGLRVMDVAIAHLFHHRTPSEIASDYGIDLAQSHAALAYYYQNQQGIDADIRQQLELLQQAKEQHTGSAGDSLLPG